MPASSTQTDGAARIWSPASVHEVIKGLGTSTAPVHIETDAGQAFVKTLGNPQGPDALICEYVGTQLARWLGLPTFDMSLIQWPSQYVLEYGGGCSSVPGTAFATRAVVGRIWDGSSDDLELLENPAALAGLVVFDTWTRNCDRYRVRGDEIRCNYGNVFLSEEAARGKQRLLAIDHTECFRCGRSLTRQLFNIDCVRDQSIYGLFPAFVRLVTRDSVKFYLNSLRRFRREHMAQILQGLPRDWGLKDDTAEALRNFCVDRAAFIAQYGESWLHDACSWQDTAPIPLDALRRTHPMMEQPAVYSLIQFHPDVARGEGANVGVVVVCPELGTVRVRMSENNERVKKLFKTTSFDDVRLSSAKRALKRRLEALKPSKDAFVEFLSRESGQLVIQQPRQMLVRELDADVARLFSKLVGEMSRRNRSKGPNLEPYFRELIQQHLVRKNATVEVPVVGKTLHAPFAFDNSKRNYIKPQGFKGDEDATIQAASGLGVVGMMLAKHSKSDRPERLIVVGEFKNDVLKEKVRGVLNDCLVRLVPTEEMPAFVEEVRQVAHALTSVVPNYGVAKARVMTCVVTGNWPALGPNGGYDLDRRQPTARRSPSARRRARAATLAAGPGARATRVGV